MLSRRDMLRIALASGAACVVGHAQAAARVTDPPIPPAYAAAARAMRVPARVHYAVALQESVMRYGRKHLPYPWTLNVETRPERFDTSGEAVARLDALLRRGVRNIDCGAMQVNWRWHEDKLVSPKLALHPFRNLDIGARILAERYAETPDWFTAVGRYHSPGDAARARRYARLVYARMAQIEAA